jgi:hypothetical protein
MFERIAALVVVCASSTMLTACAARYQMPSGVTATATVNIERANTSAGLTTASNQFLEISKENRCAGRQTLSSFGPLSGSRKSVRVEAGRTQIFTATTRYHFANGVAFTGGGAVSTVGSNGCQNRVSFTPRAGEIYRVRQFAAIDQACSIEVISQGTNAPPPDLENLETLAC